MASNTHSGSRAASGVPSAAAPTNSFSRNNSTSGKGQHQIAQPTTLSQRFPVNSLQDLTLQTGEKVSGRIYCTDEMTGSIVIQTALLHTTLATEVRIVSSDTVVSSTIVPEASDSAAVVATPLTQPLARIHKKTLDDREKRAIKLAEESLRHINQKATAVGQAVFDRLLKACGEVVWAPGDSASILVLNQVQVDAPYQPENCKIIVKTGPNGRLKQGALEDGSLDRVRKIVSAATSNSSTGGNNSSKT